MLRVCPLYALDRRRVRLVRRWLRVVASRCLKHFHPVGNLIVLLTFRYENNLDHCGIWDDDDFIANDMRCACGGGGRARYSAEHEIDNICLDSVAPTEESCLKAFPRNSPSSARTRPETRRTHTVTVASGRFTVFETFSPGWKFDCSFDYQVR